VASKCTFKDVLFRVDARLEFPRGTLLRCEHKGTVKGLIKELLVSFPSRSALYHLIPIHRRLTYYKLQVPETEDQTPSPPKKRTVGPEPKAGAKPNKRRKPDAAMSGQGDSDTEPETKKAKKPRPTPKPKVKETKTDKVSKSEVKKSSTKSKASENKPAISAVSRLANLAPCTH
jgi:outer membrane biosynthesis protein TonB